MIIKKEGMNLELQLEGPDLVLYQKSVDHSKPRVWVDGMAYQFNSNLISRKAMGNRKLLELFEVL